jgi:hypothetical protein
MTYLRGFLLKLVVGAVVCAGTTSIAMACGCSSSRSISLSTGDADDTALYATSTFSFSYLCQAETWATITAPDTTSTTADSWIQSSSPISVTDSYVPDSEGTYTGMGTYYYDGQDAGLGQGYMQALYQTAPLTKIRAYYLKYASGPPLNTYHRCNTNSKCDTLASKQSDNFMLITVWRIYVGLAYACQADVSSKVVQSMCLSPDPIP